MTGGRGGRLNKVNVAGAAADFCRCAAGRLMPWRLCYNISRCFATRHASIAFLTFSLPRISCLWRFTVWILIDRASAICLLIRPLSISLKTCISLSDNILVLVLLSSSCVCPVAELIIDSSLSRHESRGLHYNADYPYRDPELDYTDTIIQREF